MSKVRLPSVVEIAAYPDYLAARQAQFRDLQETILAGPPEAQLVLSDFMIEALIRLGYLPPLPLGARTMAELRDRSRETYLAYFESHREIVRRPEGGERAPEVVTVGIFEEWLLIRQAQS